MKLFTACFFIIIASCTSRNGTTTTETINADSIAKVDSVQEAEPPESDCVFNNDYKGLAMEWIQQLEIQTYQWDSVNLRAVDPMSTDTLYLKQGGCGHFGISFEFKLHTNSHSLTDSAYWITKSMELAKGLNYQFYDKSVEAGNFHLGRKDANSIWFDVDDDDPEDNLIYDGILIKEEKGDKIVSMTVYYN